MIGLLLFENDLNGKKLYVDLCPSNFPPRRTSATTLDVKWRNVNILLSQNRFVNGHCK